MRVLDDRPRWDVEGADWPNRETSRFVDADGLQWHVQVSGAGPTLLLLHGTGASTHSWRGMMPILSKNFTVIAPDLPGHAFTSAPPEHRLSIEGMARSISALLNELGMTPFLIGGHSAGAAILMRMCIDQMLAPVRLISLNGALLPFGGIAGRIFLPLAQLLATTSAAPRWFAWRAESSDVIERLLRDTGSRIDPFGVELYRRLAQSPGHVAAALAMMANWRLEDLQRDMGKLVTPIDLLVGTRDQTVPPSVAQRVKRMVPNANIYKFQRLGHLSHEEDPKSAADHFRYILMSDAPP